MNARLWHRGLPVVAVTAVGLAACSLLVPLNEQQCSVTSDCTARGGDFVGAACVNNVCVAHSVNPAKEGGAPDAGAVDAGPPPSDDAAVDADPWGCLGVPHPLPSGSDQIAITIKAFDALTPITTAGAQGGSDFTVISYVPVTGVTVQPCDPLDPSCKKGVASPQVTDDAGEVSFDLPRNFTGFFQFNEDGYLPSKLYMGNQPADASVFQPPAAILSIQETQALAAALGTPMATDSDSGVGHAFVQVYDCFDRHAQGVSLAFAFSGDAGADTVQWYYDDNFPSRTADRTDSFGTGGEINLPAGAVTVKATIVDGNRALGTANIVISPGGSTFAWVRARTL